VTLALGREVVSSMPLSSVVGGRVMVETTLLAHHGTLASLGNFIIIRDRYYVHFDSSQVFNTVKEFSVLAVEKSDASA